MDQGRGDLRPLTHSLGVGVDLAVLGVLQLHHRQGTPGCLLRIGEPVQAGAREDVLPAAEVGVQGLSLRHQPEATIDLVVVPDALAIDLDGPGGRGQEAGHHVQQRRLAGAVGSQQARHAGPDGQRHVVDGNHVPVPARYVLQVDGAHTSALRYRSRSAPTAAAMSAVHRSGVSRARREGRAHLQCPGLEPVEQLEGGEEPGGPRHRGAASHAHRDRDDRARDQVDADDGHDREGADPGQAGDRKAQRGQEHRGHEHAGDPGQEDAGLAPGVAEGGDVSEQRRHEHDQDGDPHNDEQPAGERGELRPHVVIALQRPREVEREHAEAEVARDQLGGLGGDEEHDRKLQVVGVAGVGDRVERGEQGYGGADHRRDADDGEQHERNDLGPGRPAQPEDAAQAVDVERPHGVAPAQPGPVVVPVPDVVDDAARLGELRCVRFHGYRTPTGSPRRSTP